MFHLSVFQVTLCSARSVRSLRGKQTVEISVERTLAIALAVAFGRRIGHQRAQRAWRFSFSHFPIQAIFFTGITYNFGGINAGRFSIPGSLSVLALCLNEGAAGTNGIEFIATNAARQNFIS